jgi:hypothetical protein
MPTATVPATHVSAAKSRSRGTRNQRSAKRRGRHQYAKAFHRILPFFDALFCGRRPNLSSAIAVICMRDYRTRTSVVGECSMVRFQLAAECAPQRFPRGKTSGCKKMQQLLQMFFAGLIKAGSVEIKTADRHKFSVGDRSSTRLGGCVH